MVIGLTCFMYGQTGSGKSYTTFGSAKRPGLVPRICERIYAEPSSIQVLVTLSFVEIYKERIYDLLDDRQEKQIRMGQVRDMKERICDRGLYCRNHPKGL